MILPITLSPPDHRSPQSPKVYIKVNLSTEPIGVTLEVSCFSHFFFHQTTVGIYDTSQNGRSRTNTYLFLNCRMNINLHLHKCPEKASMCQVPGCKKIVKKKDMNVHLKEASTSHFALQSGEIKRLRGIIYYKVSCLFTNLNIN